MAIVKKQIAECFPSSQLLHLNVVIDIAVRVSFRELAVGVREHLVKCPFVLYLEGARFFKLILNAP